MDVILFPEGLGQTLAWPLLSLPFRDPPLGGQTQSSHFLMLTVTVGTQL